MKDNAWNMYVFRDGVRRLRTASLVRDLEQATKSWGGFPGSSEPSLDLLLRAGELECGLTDAGCGVPNLETLTDVAARRLVNPDIPVPLPPIEFSLTPDDVRVSPAEGFAYYALHPLDFADLAATVLLKAPEAAIIGIRSIGSTLSAVVLAAIERRAMPASRITVRPKGHPYNRQTQFSPEQLRWIEQRQKGGAEFLVVDEGPGMSGSSFLSVGDALIEAGVERDRIQFLCSRQPNPAQLRARDAANRWLSYRTHCVAKNWRLPQAAKLYAGGGQWREYLYDCAAAWPASWIQMERLKFWSADRKTLYRFEGFGRYGADVRQRAECVAAGGFGPMPFHHENGFTSYPALKGRPLQRSDLDRVLLELMARYCAFRASQMRARDPQSTEEMETMLRFNIAEEFGVEVEGQRPVLHPSAVPVMADGRMMPWEWIRTDEGRIFKTDVAEHGDDHFFPGPTDIAWDLAGATIEWDMPREAADYFLEQYGQFSGDAPAARMPGYQLAYAVFRMAYCKMAAAAIAGSGEEERLMRDYRWYRAKAALLLPQGDLAAAD
jgi:hypothetical protein